MTAGDTMLRWGEKQMMGLASKTCAPRSEPASMCPDERRVAGMARRRAADHRWKWLITIRNRLALKALKRTRSDAISAPPPPDRLRLAARLRAKEPSTPVAARGH
jgi:hypothetical protein